MAQTTGSGYAPIKTMSFVKVKAVVTDKGDPSVGIFPCSWTVECPFYKDADQDSKEWFRKQIEKVYSEFAEGRILVDYDYELEMKDDIDF